LKLTHDEPHSNFAFKFNLRRYSEGTNGGYAFTPSFREVEDVVRGVLDQLVLAVSGRGLHSFTSQLKSSAFYGIGGARRGSVARVKEVFRVCKVFCVCQTRLKLS
jgi:hypothetical protein